MEDAPYYQQSDLIEKDSLGFIFNYEEKGISDHLSKSNSVSLCKDLNLDKDYEKEVKADFDRLRSYSDKSSDSEEIISVLQHQQPRSSFGNINSTSKINMKGRVLINDFNRKGLSKSCASLAH